MRTKNIATDNTIGWLWNWEDWIHTGETRLCSRRHGTSTPLSFRCLSPPLLREYLTGCCSTSRSTSTCRWCWENAICTDMVRTDAQEIVRNSANVCCPGLICKCLLPRPCPQMFVAQALFSTLTAILTVTTPQWTREQVKCWTQNWINICLFGIRQVSQLQTILNTRQSKQCMTQSQML